MSGVVLDASALLALVFDEKGGALVRERLDDGVLSAVTLAESHAKMLDRGFAPSDAESVLIGLGLTLVDMTAGLAFRCGALLSAYRRDGLSFADCACLALAAEMDAPVLTGDRKWTELDHGVEVELFR